MVLGSGPQHLDVFDVKQPASVSFDISGAPAAPSQIGTGGAGHAWTASSSTSGGSKSGKHLGEAA